MQNYLGDLGFVYCVGLYCRKKNKQAKVTFQATSKNFRIEVCVNISLGDVETN